MKTAIKVEHLSKKYIIQHQRNSRYNSFRDSMNEKAKSLFRSASNLFVKKQIQQPTKEEFWALNDINFNVLAGERIGIIGRNGAGKSTLLKILSRITEPTSGRISIAGRVASLLEVGTGFHPELTGRENIFLNGAILGMHREEIKRKFDEIVNFSGVEKFLDTPVKRYSSGMYVRLAFAVAAHLESDILIVDEVLAVGDAEFQKKCLGKMQDISQNNGRTILFVSHNMQAITNLCSRVILLDKGTIIQDSTSAETIRNYLMFESVKSGELQWNDDTAPGDSHIKLNAIKILDGENNVRNHFFSKSVIKIQLDFTVLNLVSDLVIGVDVTDEDGAVLFRTYQNDSSEEIWPVITEGKNSIYCEIPGSFFNAGTYYICPKISLHCKKWIIDGDPLLSFEIDLNHGPSPYWNVYTKANRPGSLALVLPWRKTEI